MYISKQNIKRIKIRKNAKSILSDEEMALKKMFQMKQQKCRRHIIKYIKSFIKLNNQREEEKQKLN